MGKGVRGGQRLKERKKGRLRTGRELRGPAGNYAQRALSPEATSQPPWRSALAGMCGTPQQRHRRASSTHSCPRNGSVSTVRRSVGSALDGSAPRNPVTVSMVNAPPPELQLMVQSVGCGTPPGDTLALRQGRAGQARGAVQLRLTTWEEAGASAVQLRQGHAGS